MSDINVLDSTTPSVQFLCKKDKKLAKVVSLVGTITYKPYGNSYAFLVETIIGQMLSNKVAHILCERLSVLCNNELSPSTIAALSNDEIKEIGISKSKVQYIRHLTIPNLGIHYLLST